MKNLSYLKYFFTYMRDPDFPLYEKIIMVLGILYIIVPVDIIPEALFPVGIIDDSAVLTGLVLFMTKAFKSYYDRTLTLRKQQIEAKKNEPQKPTPEWDEEW